MAAMAAMRQATAMAKFCAENARRNMAPSKYWNKQRRMEFLPIFRARPVPTGLIVRCQQPKTISVQPKSL
jgi:hypothetical protein